MQLEYNVESMAVHVEYTTTVKPAIKSYLSQPQLTRTITLQASLNWVVFSTFLDLHIKTNIKTSFILFLFAKKEE